MITLEELTTESSPSTTTEINEMSSDQSQSSSETESEYK